MVKVKITKNIMNKDEIIFNLNLKQLIVGGIGVAVGIGMFFLLKNYLILDVLMWLIFLEIALVVGFAVVQINDMSLFEILWKTIKRVDKRPYSNNKGVYDKDDFSIF